MLNERKIVLKYCPYGRLFIEDGAERMVMGRQRVMREIGRLMDEAHRQPMEIRFIINDDSEEETNE